MGSILQSLLDAHSHCLNVVAIKKKSSHSGDVLNFWFIPGSQFTSFLQRVQMLLRSLGLSQGSIILLALDQKDQKEATMRFTTKLHYPLYIGRVNTCLKFKSTMLKYWDKNRAPVWNFRSDFCIGSMVVPLQNDLQRSCLLMSSLSQCTSIILCAL